jgi:hypothetical protein
VVGLAIVTLPLSLLLPIVIPVKPLANAVKFVILNALLSVPFITTLREVVFGCICSVFVPVNELAILAKLILLSAINVKDLLLALTELLKVIDSEFASKVVLPVPVKVTALLKVKLPLLVVIFPGIWVLFALLTNNEPKLISPPKRIFPVPASKVKLPVPLMILLKVISPIPVPVETVTSLPILV